MGLLRDIEDWWQHRKKSERLLIFGIIAVISVSAFVLDTLSSINVGYWGGIVLYGLLSMMFGASELFEADSKSGSIEIFDFEVDSLLISQVFALAVAVSTVLFGRVLLEGSQFAIETLTRLQICGLLIIVSRLVPIVESKADIFHGRWSWSIFTLGVTLLLVSPFIPTLPIVGVQRLLPKLAVSLLISLVVLLYETDIVRI